MHGGLVARVTHTIWGRSRSLFFSGLPKLQIHVYPYMFAYIFGHFSGEFDLYPITTPQLFYNTFRVVASSASVDFFRFSFFSTGANARTK